MSLLGYSSFLTLVRAESFPQNITWTMRDVFALLVLPLIFFNGYIFQKFGLSGVALGQVDALCRGLLFATLCVLYQDMLYGHWQKFKQAFWHSCVLVLVGAVLLQVVISLTRHLLPVTRGISDDASSISLETVSIFALFIISLSPLFTALLEDVVFRYTLLQKLFVQPWLWRVILVLGNSILFGLIHYHNFNGNLIATISFMSAGLFLNLMYLWTRNIWHVLLIHFLNNAVLSFGGLILFKILQHVTAV